MLKLKFSASAEPEVKDESGGTAGSAAAATASAGASSRGTSAAGEAGEGDGLPRLSLSVAQPKAPKIRVKTSSRHGEGYDSEAPDREEDPLMEESIVLRMMPGAGLDHLSKAVASNDFSGISFKWEDQRRAIVTIKGEMYAGQLVDLPTVTEIFKTFDRKNIFKTTDVSQMLLVTSKIARESDAASVRPEPVLYPHGITPPLHNVRSRRFHQRMSNKAIETIEQKVDELFRRDIEAVEVEHRLLDPAEVMSEQAYLSALAGDNDDDDEEEEEEDDDMLGMELERALEAENSDGDMDDEDDEDDDDDDDLDEEAQDNRQQNKLLKEEIKELQATIDSKQRDADNTANQIMKGRLIDVVARMQKELDMKFRLLKDVEEKNERNAPIALNADGTTADAKNGAAGDAEDEDEDEDAMDVDDEEEEEAPRSETPAPASAVGSPDVSGLQDAAVVRSLAAAAESDEAAAAAAAAVAEAAGVGDAAVTAAVDDAVDDDDDDNLDGLF